MTQGSNSIELRRPLFGDSEDLNFPHLLSRESDNLFARFRDPDWPVVREFNLVIQILICSATMALPLEVETFLTASNGKLITLEEFDFDDVTVLITRQGILFLDDAIELKPYWNYSFRFQETL